MLNQATRTTDTDLIIRAARIAENVARHLNATGLYAVALDDFSVLRSIRERALGADHPDTRNQLARWTGEAGDILAARDQYAALLPVQKRILGPDHPATLASWQGLAQWTGLAATQPLPAISSPRCYRFANGCWHRPSRHHRQPVAN
ncbi:tetratricopeptide repeat protein [Micromonospora sp. M51]|uniref:tetratricopeptide repeat protein n=1 Tax=Micromonospora TaxID=1873 RepID=UPI001B3952DA|nr:tetratricopeptide repeat protein [Micromonospora sp. M51]MBQ1010612.1 tetratricopeptide repeat protein [Micromonospora sp. M51]